MKNNFKAIIDLILPIITSENVELRFIELFEHFKSNLNHLQPKNGYGEKETLNINKFPNSTFNNSLFLSSLLKSNQFLVSIGSEVDFSLIINLLE